jgi:heptosyltransferase I
LRFLISRLSALGDLVCTLPVAAALKAGHPDCEIVWAADPRFAGIAECCRHVDQVLRVKPGFAPGQWPRVDGEFDVALDMQGLLKSALVVALAKADRKLGYHWQREGARLFSSPVLPDPTSFHVVDQYVDVARAVGGIADRADFGLVPKDEDLASVRCKLAERGVEGPFVAMNPGAGWATKRWPPTHFARLVDALAADGVRSVLLGGKAEIDRLASAEVLSHCRERPAEMGGQTSVRELVALIAECAAHVGGDTGSTHLAAALDRPAVGLYSITRPMRTGPYGQIERCHYDPVSLAQISAEEVLAAVREALR